MINLLPQPTQTPTREDEIAELMNKYQNKKQAEQSLTEFLLAFKQKVDNDNQRARRIRLQTMVAMCRRHRGATPSDLFGTFHPSYDIWLEHAYFGDLHGANVFQALIRGAEANYTQANVKLDIKATGNDFQNRACEKISKGIYEILNETHWTETVEQQLFYAMILKLNGFIISRFNPHKGKEKIKSPQFQEQPYETEGTYICPQCESYGDFTSETGYKCQQCGNEDGLTLVNEPQQDVTDIFQGYSAEMDAGEIETIIGDGFDCDFDDSVAECSSFNKAQWFEYHYLCDKDELKRIWGHLEHLDNAPNWTLATRWKMALKRHSVMAVNPTSEMDKRLQEVREFYLESNLYADRGTEKADVKLGDKVIIKQGEDAKDIFPNGMLAIMIGEEVADVYDADFKRLIKHCVWLADPTSGHGLGAKAGLPIQKKINHLDNLNMEGIDRALRGAIVYDPQAINGTDLEGNNTNIPLRPDFALGDKQINQLFAPITTAGLSQDVVLFLQTQHDIMQKIMGVPDAAIGETDPNNVTATGQQLEAHKATGLLVPAKKSQARAMEGWLLDQLTLIKNHYTPERVKKEFGSRFGEDWLDDELEAFFTSDLDDAITISYVEGSEVPQTRAEKEAKLGAMMSAGFIPPTPSNINKLVSQSGLEGIDVGDYESNLKIAQRRWSLIQDAYKQNPEGYEMQFAQAEMMMTDPTTGQRMTDPMGNKIPNPLVSQLLSTPDLQVIPEAEDAVVQEDYWKGKTRELLGSNNQSPLLLELSRSMILKHQQGGLQQAMVGNALTALSQAPAQQMGAEMQMNNQRQIDDQTGQRKPKPTSQAVSRNLKTK